MTEQQRLDGEKAIAALNGGRVSFGVVDNLVDIKSRCGSFRRMVQDYWLGDLNRAEELIVEDRIPPETLIGYKPIR